MQATRQQILDYLRQRGEGSVRDLGAHLDLTPTGVRQHLAILEREGLVTSRELRGQVGRPALAYRLTTKAEDLYPKSYDRLARAVLDSARAALSPDAYAALVKGAAATLAASSLPAMAGLAPAQRLEAVCTLLRERDVVASWAPDGASGFVLIERTCPFRDVAVDHPAVCAMDTEWIGRLTGMRPELDCTIASGAEHCIYHLVPEIPVREITAVSAPTLDGPG